MFLNSLKMQLINILEKKSTVITFFVTMGFMLLNFFENVINNSKVMYTSQMQEIVKGITLSDWSNSGYFFMQFLPILIVIPTACAYITDKDTRIKVYIESRCGKKNYWYTKLLSVFIATFLIFVIPFLIELLMSIICFDVTSKGDPSLFEYYQTVEADNRYMFSSLYIYNGLLYGVVMIFILATLFAILATFNFSITTFSVFKFKIFTFFPIYLMLYIIKFIQRAVKLDYSVDYFLVLRLFNFQTKNYVVYSAFFIALILISILLINIKIKRDEII